MSTSTPLCAPVVVVGGGFTGLAAAYELAKAGKSVVVLEQDDRVGGLAQGFDVGGVQLERFYHHWFTNDTHIIDLVRDLGRENDVIYRPTRTGLYYAGSFYRLSAPLDVLKFTALSVLDRIRLGLMVVQVRQIKNWRSIESLTAREWLIGLAGKKVFEVVWEPLLAGKFGPYADAVGAVWFWKKIALRGSSRGKSGKEVLAYFRGGFAELARALREEIVKLGGDVRTGTRVIGLEIEDGKCTGATTSAGRVAASNILLTTPLPTIADLLAPHVEAPYVTRLRRVEYLANVCLILELKQSLSTSYWLNVNDPSFPFVGIIEHTNFEAASTYGGRHIVYLSKYLPESSALYQMSDQDVLDFAVPYIKKMFPAFEREWIGGYHVWRAQYSQPIAVPNYSNIVPSEQTPISNVWISTLAQIYPEDRGTNYAVREGRKIGRDIATRN